MKCCLRRPHPGCTCRRRSTRTSRKNNRRPRPTHAAPPPDADGRDRERAPHRTRALRRLRRPPRLPHEVDVREHGAERARKRERAGRREGTRPGGSRVRPLGSQCYGLAKTRKRILDPLLTRVRRLFCVCKRSLQTRPRLFGLFVCLKVLRVRLARFVYKQASFVNRL